MADKRPQRLLFVEPNPCDRQIIPTEDLSISVELKTITRGRSVISGNGDEGTGTISNNNDGQASKVIGFIEGSPVGDRRSLTTNYTEINTSFSTGGENDLEALGIESINIKFDTAYIPQISIKFIDVRGQSILQQGSSSKYKMFFEMPFPIFELTVKGFYGKAVTYCLHLRSWNASFNSQTGNFEIQTEFIGYTFALLTDCIIGYIRAAALTTRGETLFEKYKTETENGVLKYPNLIRIDKFLDYVNKTGRDFKKLKEDSEEIKQINSITNLISIFKKLNKSIVTLSKDISTQGINDLLDSNLSDVVLIAKINDNDVVSGLIKKFKTDTFRAWDGDTGINETIEIDNLKIKTDLLNKIKKTELVLSDFANSETLSSALSNSGNGYDNEELRNKFCDKIIRNFIIKPKANLTNFTLYDFSTPFKEASDRFENAKSRKETLTTKLTNLLKKKVNEQQFKPTIKNIIDILSVHSQIFLQTIRRVSKDAEANPERRKILIEKLGYNNMDIKDGQTIYPWPEYKSVQSAKSFSLNEVESSTSDTSLYETWIGSKLTEQEFSSVPEVEFVEEILEKLMKIAKSDESRSVSGIKTPLFFPVSPIDAPISYNDEDKLITHNPYYKAIIKDGQTSQKTTPYNAYRCLMMRGFNGLGLANRIIGKNQIEIMGTLEADNLFNIITSELDKVDKTTMINAISGLLGGNEDDQVNEILDKLSKPVKDITNPLPEYKGALLKTEDIIIDKKSVKYYKYTYLDELNVDKVLSKYKSFIPVSGGFDCRGFVNTNNTLKSNKELKDLGSSLLFVGNRVNISGSGLDSSDGAIYLKIIDINTYENTPSSSPQYGDGPISEYLNIVGEKTLIKQSNLQITTYSDNDQLDEKLNRYNGRFKSLEINNIFYDGTERSSTLGITNDSDLDTEQVYYTDENTRRTFGEKAGDVISAFYYQDTDIDREYNGTYLAQKPSNLYKASGHQMPKEASDIFKILPSTINSLYEPNEVDIKNDLDFSSRYWNLPTRFGEQRELIGDVIKGGEAYIPFVEFGIDNDIGDSDHHLSLFGSRFYYKQPQIGRAFLYLHCISWEGIHGNLNNSVPIYKGGDTFTSSLFNTFEINTTESEDEYSSFEDNDDTFTIKGLFGNSGSFIKVPKLWCAFIGALLYRQDNISAPQSEYATKGDIINFKDLILPWQHKESYTPAPDEYLYSATAGSTCGVSFFFDGDDIFKDDTIKENTTLKNNIGYGLYAKVDEVILGLPPQAREEFKRIFIEFFEGNFKTIQKYYELFNTGSSDGDVSRLETTHDNLLGKVKKKFIFKYQADNSYFAAISGEREDTEFYVANPNLFYVKGQSTTENPEKGFKYTPKYFEKEIDAKLSGVINLKGTGGKVFEDDTLTKQDVIDSFTNGLPEKELNRVLKVINNYDNISPINDDNFEKKQYVFDLTMKGNIKANKFITNLLADNYMIVNNRPSIFRSNYGRNPLHPDESISDGTTSINTRPTYQPIRVEADKMKLYLNKFFKRFNTLANDFKDPETDANDKYQKKVFNSIDDDTIKLNIYRTLSSINSKWIGGDVSNKCANIDTIASSFRYIDSSFRDIGDTFLINPKTVYDKIINNYNQSFFDVAQSILTNNNFSFIPLPSFINFKKLSELEDAFKAYSYNESVNKAIVGPSFVCVYTGQKSSNLDLGENSEYEDDGFYIQNDGCGKMTGKIPPIFRDAEGDKALQIPYFLVSYGKDNQSMFKDIKLDQREFVETAESLEMIESISNSGNRRKPTFNGQNLFNVYQKRSYSAEISAMGNAMIQPMMYFQLNNIPMFKGAYLINKVTHSITPHNMSTTFKGQRIKKTKVQLIKEEQLFMNLLGPLESAGLADTITDNPKKSSKTVVATTSAEETNSEGTTNKTQTNLVSATGGNVSSSTATSGSKINTNVKSIII